MIVRFYALVVASAMILSAVGASRSQAPNASLPDLVALLLSDLEDGRSPDFEIDPAKRTVVDGAVSYQTVRPSVFYRAAPVFYQNRANSKFERRTETFRELRPCVLQIDTVWEYSHGDSKEAYAADSSDVRRVLDLSNYERLDFEPGPIVGALVVTGEKALCQFGRGAPDCVNSYTWIIGPQGGLTRPVSEREAFFARKRQAVEMIKAKHCPGKR